MDLAKLKVKIGEHEFEAEGPTDIVQAQFAAFRELVSNLPARPPENQVNKAAPNATKSGELMLDKIMKHDDRIVSLTARGESLDHEIMLVLLGQKVLRSNDSVTGAEIADGLRQTGRTINRIDYQLDKMTQVGDVITIGMHRARRYRLSNQGFAKAQELAMALVEKVA
jgi:hypothetical protein